MAEIDVQQTRDGVLIVLHDTDFQRFAGYGKKVYAWTANAEASMLKIICMGADGMVTDNPPLADFFLKAIDKNYFLESLTELLYPRTQ